MGLAARSTGAPSLVTVKVTVEASGSVTFTELMTTARSAPTKVVLVMAS